jgi:hypothetical protein
LAVHFKVAHFQRAIGQSHALIIETFLGHQVSAISNDGVVHARIGEQSSKADVF